MGDLWHAKTAAARVGLDVDEYIRRREQGLKHCVDCKRWLGVDVFGKDASRGDGRASKCIECARLRYQRSRPQMTLRLSQRGRRYVEARDGDKLQARRRVNHLVDLGVLANPNTCPCTDCGHTGDDRRHEYDHHLGYAPEHHEHVEPVCTKCHAAREGGRRDVSEDTD